VLTFFNGYSLGALHHASDTQAGMKACIEKLKPSAPFLVYLYYNFDNQPWSFKTIWHISDIFRNIISRSPYGLRRFSSQMIAALVCLPLARLSRIMEMIGLNASNSPLISAYRNKNFHTMHTDTVDRFYTHLEQRFPHDQIKIMIKQVGLEQIKLSANDPFWCAVGYRFSKEKVIY